MGKDFIDLKKVFKDMGVFESYKDNNYEFELDYDTRNTLMDRYKKTLSHFTNLWCSGSPDGYECSTCSEYVDILLPVFELVRLRSSRADNLIKTDFVDKSNFNDSTDERSDLFYTDDETKLREELKDMEVEYKRAKAWKQKYWEQSQERGKQLDKLEEELKISRIKYDELNKNYKELASSNLGLRWQLNEGDKS